MIGRRGERAIRALALLTLSLAACGLPTSDTFVYEADAPEPANASVVEGKWQSAPPFGADWLPYPPRATLEVAHGLGRTPVNLDVWLSFEESGAEPAKAAGDLARWIDADDATVTVRNETSAMFFARIIVE